MAERYGRNQKRRHRLEIEAQGVQLDMAARLIKHKDDDIAKYRRLYLDIVDNIEHFCKNSVLLNPKQMVKDYLPRGMWMDVYEPMPMSYLADHHAVAMDVHSVLMHVITIMGERNILDDAIHVRMTIEGGDKPEQFAYAISNRVIRDSHNLKGFINFAKEEVTRSLLHAMGEKYAKL